MILEKDVCTFIWAAQQISPKNCPKCKKSIELPPRTQGRKGRLGSRCSGGSNHMLVATTHFTAVTPEVAASEVTDAAATADPITLH